MKGRATAAAIAALAVACATAAAAPSPRIVGGTPAADGAYPFMTALVDPTADPDAGVVCGATLVSPQVLLTAAHCFHERDATRLEARVGAQRLSAEDGEPFAVDRFSIAPHDVDVALLRLERPAGAAPVTIADAGDAAGFAPGASARAIGWGLTKESGKDSDRLREVDVPVVSDEECERVHEAQDPVFRPATSICAGARGRDTCQGDSGGPLLVAGDSGGLEQVGVTSYGRGCGRANFYGVYVELPPVAGFVLDPDPTWAPAPGRERARIEGTPRPGETVRCEDGDWDGREIEYRWFWSATNRAGFLGRRPKLRLHDRDAGKRIYCAVVASNPGGDGTLQSGVVRVGGGGGSG